MSRFEMCLRATLGAILFAAWIWLTYYPPVGNDSALLMFIQVTLGVLAGHSAATTKNTT